MADNKQNNKTENKSNKSDGQKIDYLAPLDEFKMPADDAVQEAGSRAAIHADLEEAPNPVSKQKQSGK